MSLNISTVKTAPFKGQEFGTSGIRKAVKVFQTEHYLNNLLAAIFKVCLIKGKTIVLGGDGRFFNKEAIVTALKMLIAAEAKKVYIGQNGWFSTPAISIFIKKYKLDYGIIFSASHNPAGKNGDFGVKVNGSNGSSISETLCEKIYQQTKLVINYNIVDNFDFNLAQLQQTKILNTEIEVVDPIKDYSALMEEIFNFNKIAELFKNGFSMSYEGYNAITGIYAKNIFAEKLGVPANSLCNITPLEDFGGLHADPNSLYAKHLIDLSNSSNSPDILFASDGDGDRNMIIGKAMPVSPSDSLAILVQHASLIPYYRNNLGVARSMPTTRAVDSVAKALKLNCYATPTGWRFFGNLLENQKITFCGEESYGTSSSHSGEKDGIWAMLFWLNIIAELKLSVKTIIENLWQRYGRYYYGRLDYLGLSLAQKQEVFNNFMALNSKAYLNESINISIFSYTDPVTSEFTTNKGHVMTIGDNTRIVLRASGTDTSSVTLRLYLEKFESDSKKIYQNHYLYLKELQDLVKNTICKGLTPSIID